MRVLILDLTHGGDILAGRFLGERDDVTCVDVYGISTQEQRDSLTASGARVLREVPPEGFDLLVSPAHCPDVFLEGCTFSSRITFSGAVNRFVDKGIYRIEVTGVKGKTSTCYVLAHILDASGKKVYLHTSRGTGPYSGGKHLIEKKMSIAPTSILKLPSDGYDVVVCEVSLGGSGKADIACITNLVEDYGIAKNTFKASEAKRDVFTDRGTNIVLESEREFWSQYHDGLVGYGGRVRVLSRPALGEGLRVSVDYDGESEVTLDGSYVATEYIGAMDLALEVCHRMGVPRESVLRSLETFRGVPGRGEILHEDGRTVVRERNPGISHISIGRTLQCLKEMDALDGAMVLLDPVSRKVCDKLDRDQIERVVAEHGVPLVITRGDGERPGIPSDVRLLIEFVKEGYQ